MRVLLGFLGFLLIVIWLQLGYLNGGTQLLWLQLYCLGILAVICVALYFIIGWINRRITLWRVPSGRMTGDRPSRRYAADIRKTDEEMKLEALDDAELVNLIDRHPRYALAIEIWCERLKARSEWSEYTRQIQYMLSIPNDLSPEEVCRFYYELSDIYMNRLNRRDRAEVMIRSVIATFPKKGHAVEARKRLAEMQRMWGENGPAN